MIQTDEYLEAQVMTASPHQLHLMVVDGAIRFATRAEQAIENDDIEAAHCALNDSRAFVTELISGLKDGEVPELTERLRGLFLFVYRNLIDADSEKDVQKVRDSLKILRSHRETWVELGEKLSPRVDAESN